MVANGRDTTSLVRETVYKSCLLLDDMKWADWLAMCDEDFKYTITAYSPEIRRDMRYMGGDFKEMKILTDLLPKHNTDHSPLKRHATVYSVDVDEKAGTATAVTSLVVYQNMLDGVNSHLDAGESRLFLVGRYIDKFRIADGHAKFVDREVRLETRRLDKGSHYPI